MHLKCGMESWQVVRVFVINFIDYNILIKILSEAAIFLMTLQLQFLIKFSTRRLKIFFSSSTSREYNDNSNCRWMFVGSLHGKAVDRGERDVSHHSLAVVGCLLLC